MTLRVIFAGTSEFSLPTLKALHQSDHDIVTVLTQPDRPAGRGRKPHPSPIKLLAQSLDIPTMTFNRLHSEACDQLINLNADVMVVVSYGLLIPQKLLNAFEYGGINIHPSLLPRWRGAAPIPRAILAGDTQTGVCIMQMTAELDAGDIYQQQTIEISDQDTTQTLEKSLSNTGAALLMETLDALPHGTCHQLAQHSEGICYAEKIERFEAKLDWQQSAEHLSRCIRAFNPKPGAFCLNHQQALKIWGAQALPGTSIQRPGTVTEVHKDSIDVATGYGILRVTELQPPGKKRLPVQAYLLGTPLEKGHLFD